MAMASQCLAALPCASRPAQARAQAEQPVRSALAPCRGLPSASKQLAGASLCSAAGRLQRSSVSPLRAVAQDAAPASAPASSEQPQWYACVANAEFMLNNAQNESFAEQLRERRRLYSEQNKELDFFIVSEPAWLDARFPDQAPKVKRPCVALVSTDKIWIDFMKLRLDRVLKVSLGPLPAGEALKSTGPLPKFEKPANWTAPYAPYAPGWWEVFMPKA